MQEVDNTCFDLKENDVEVKASISNITSKSDYIKYVVVQLYTRRSSDFYYVIVSVQLSFTFFFPFPFCFVVEKQFQDSLFGALLCNPIDRF